MIKARGDEERAHINTSEHIEEDGTSSMYEGEECPDDTDGEMNNAGDDDDYSGVCDGGCNERTEKNGRRVLESADVCKVEDLRYCLFFQQDGAPPHRSIDVRRYLDKNIPNDGLVGKVRYHGRHGHQI